MPGTVQALHTAGESLPKASIEKFRVATVLSRSHRAAHTCLSRVGSNCTASRCRGVTRKLLAMRSKHRIIPTEQNSVEEPQRKLIGLSQQRCIFPAVNDEPAYLPV